MTFLQGSTVHMLILSSLFADTEEGELPEETSNGDSDQKSTSTALQEIFHTASGFAPGSQKHKAQGTILRWHKEYGAEEIPVHQYIESLEHEVSLLRREVWHSRPWCSFRRIFLLFIEASQGNERGGAMFLPIHESGQQQRLRFNSYRIN